MYGYCWKCGIRGELDKTTAWCAACLDQWYAEHAVEMPQYVQVDFMLAL